MKSLTRCIVLLIVLSALADAGSAVFAKGFLYAGKRKKINCATLWVADRNGTRDNSQEVSDVGALFFWLDRSPLKPAGWSFENPLAVSGPSTGITKDDPAYWKVKLSESGDLSRLDVLYLPAKGSMLLSDRDREKLRRFVDYGGVLWIDNAADAANPLDFDNTFFIHDFLFRAASGYDVLASRHHPLVSVPYWLTEPEVGMLGATPGRWACQPGFNPSYPELTGDVLFAVVVNNDTNGQPSVAANAYGSGRIVATANYVGKGCFALSPEYAVPNQKFAYNVMAWASSYSTFRKDPRHSGSSIDTVGGTKLLEHWSLDPGEPPANIEASPVVCKNVVFYTNGSTLYAADVFPSEDLDQNGNPDDGLPDYGSGSTGQDVIWTFPGDGMLSAPTVAAVQDPRDPGRSIEAVLVKSASESGLVYMLEAFPLDPATGGFRSAPGVITTYEAGAGKPCPPLYVNGWIYSCGGEDGRLYAYNPFLDGSDLGYPFEWQVPNLAVDFRSKLRSGPSFGFVTNESSGAVVGVVYWFVSAPTYPPPSNNNDIVYSVPVYVSNDRIQPKQVDTAGQRYQCRVTYKDGLISEQYPKPIVWIKGNPPIDSSNLTFNQPGPGMIEISNTPIAPDAVVYATYGLDYSSVSTSPRRNPLEPPSSPTSTVPPTSIAGTPAMGPDDMIYLNGKRGGAPGSVYGLSNDGTSQATRWHYLLHTGTEIPSNTPGASTFVPPVVANVDDLGGLVSMQNPQPVGSPAISGDKVFVAVKGEPSADAPTAALLCFKADSDFVIRVTEGAGYDQNGRPIRRPKSLINESTGRHMMVKVWQPNLLMGPLDPADQPLLTGAPVPADMIDYEKGTIVFDDFGRLKLRGAGMRPTSIFSASLPVWVYLDNVEVPVDWSTWGPSAALGSIPPPASSDAVDLSQWNNLLWYYIVPPYNDSTGSPVDCTGISSSPVVIGSTVYFSATYGGDEVLYALNAETGENQGIPTKSDPIWQQMISGGGIPSDANLSVASTNGMLLVPAGDGLHAFTNATTLVADTNRVVELDGAGEIAWSADSISWPAAIPTSSSKPVPRRSGPVNKPARAKYIGTGEILLVNSGANQVCKINKNGWVELAAWRNGWGDVFVRWLYDRFTDPANLLRPGQPTQLRGPTDAIFWQEMEPNVAGASKPEDYTMIIHCLVADSGNHRIVDLVYRVHNNKLVDRAGRDIPPPDQAPERYDRSTGYLLPELNWVTKTESMNERYIYDCIQLVDSNTVWAAVSNYRTGTEMSSGSPAQSQGLGGAIVALGYRTHDGYGSPWNYNAPGAGEIFARCDRMQWGGTLKPLASPRFFQVIGRPDGTRHIIFVCDNYGVYRAQVISGQPPVVDASFTDRDYRIAVREMVQEDGTATYCPDALGNCGLGAPLYATSVQELPNGNWLISNGYSGPDKQGFPGGPEYPADLAGSPNEFSGEVFEYDPNAPSGAPPIVWNSPELVVPGVPNSSPPPDFFYDLNFRRQSLKNSYIIRQPRSAVRRF